MTLKSIENNYKRRQKITEMTNRANNIFNKIDFK